MSVAVQLMHAVERTIGVPIVGVNMRDPADKSTWTVQPLATATEAQREAVTSFLETYDPVAEAARVEDETITRAFDEAVLVQALAIWTSERLVPSRPIPFAQLRAEIIAIAKGR